MRCAWRRSSDTTKRGMRARVRAVHRGSAAHVGTTHGAPRGEQMLTLKFSISRCLRTPIARPHRDQLHTPLCARALSRQCASLLFEFVGTKQARLLLRHGSLAFTSSVLRRRCYSTLDLASVGDVAASGFLPPPRGGSRKRARHSPRRRRALRSISHLRLSTTTSPSVPCSVRTIDKAMSDGQGFRPTRAQPLGDRVPHPQLALVANGPNVQVAAAQTTAVGPFGLYSRTQVRT